jgi:hypothetical protein
VPLDLIRTLRRQVRFEGPLSVEAFEFLRSQPQFETAPQIIDTIEIEQHGEFLRVELPSGHRFIGSERAFIYAINKAIIDVALLDESGTPVLLSTVLRIADLRIAIVGEDKILRSLLAILLLSDGAEFEGDGFSFVRREGLAPHPLKPRIGKEYVPLLPREAASAACSAAFTNESVLLTIDPSLKGKPWCPHTGRVDVFLFADFNEGGRTLWAPIGFQSALKTIMKAMRFPQARDIAKLSAVQAVLEGAQYFRLGVGDILETSQILAEKFEILDRKLKIANSVPIRD